MKKSRMIIAVLMGIGIMGCSKPEVNPDQLLKEGNYEEAKAGYYQAIEDGQDAGEAYRGIGIAYWEEKDYKRARAAFGKALQNGAKETGTIYNFMGVCDMQLNQMESALTQFENGLAQDGNSEDLIREMEFNAIVACENMEDWESAKLKLAEYTAKYPDDEAAKKEADFLETR